MSRPALSTPPPPAAWKSFAGCALVMLAIVLAWGAYTQHAWEDFYISYRASRHLAIGDGLVFQPGERLHTFTSPSHTLLLALLAKLSGLPDQPVGVLWLYRVIGGIGLGAALFFLHRLGRARGLARAGCIAGFGLLLCDPKAIDFTVAGMEVPLMMCFLALHLWALCGGNGWRMLGFAWAGLMWTRPDAFVLILATLAGAFAFDCADAAARRALLGRVVRAGLLGAACYAPWLIGATLYYGTPVPHTIVAKGLSQRISLTTILQTPWELLGHNSYLARMFGATFLRRAADWGTPFFYFWRTLALVAWLYWLNPWGGRMARTGSLSFFLVTLYGANVPFAAWYVPVYTMIASLTLGFVLTDLWRAAEAAGRVGDFLRRCHLHAWLIAGALVVVATQAKASAMMARSMRWQQAINETGNRQKIGLWLKAHAQPGETLFLECVGYIGYYSDLKTLDFPGLTSREVVAARRKLNTDDYGALIAELEPDWIVLRPDERENVKRSRPGLLPAANAPQPAYALAEVFDRSADIAATPHPYGRRYLEIDQTFEVYHRQAPKTRAR